MASKAVVVDSERRAELRTAVDAVLFAAVGSDMRALRVLDLSCGGALVQCGTEPLPPGLRNVRLRVAGQSVELLARVSWTEGAQQGLCFVGQSEVDRLAIAEHVDLRAVSR